MKCNFSRENGLRVLVNRSLYNSSIIWKVANRISGKFHIARIKNRI